MSAEINIAAASLLFATIAFIVALTQLLQSIFGHLEGFRRCAASSIGAWHRFRRRRLVPLEFRVEVQYVTPHFSVLTSDVAEWDAAEENFGPTFSLATLSRPLGGGGEMGEEEKRMVRSLLRGEDGEMGEEGKVVRRGSGDVEKNGSLGEGERMRVRRRRRRARLAERASWLEFLAAVQQTYSAHHEACFPSQEGGNNEGQSGTSIDLVQERRDHVTVLSSAAVSFRTWSWDFMPPDLTIPLATSTLSNIILFALRLNMEWMALDLNTRSFVADGNGYTLTSNPNSLGSGIVFSFTSTRNENTLPIFAPSRTVDKTIFGIIPGCSRLVGRDFPLVDETRRASYARLFQDIGINQKVSEKIDQGKWDEPRIEATILLSSFIPLENCQVLYNYLPGFRGRAPWTPMHNGSGRSAFLELLENRVAELQKGAAGVEDGTQTPTRDPETTTEEEDSEALRDLAEALKSLQALHNNWNADFHCTWRNSAIEGPSGPRKLALARDCKRVFDWATATLAKTWSIGHHGQKNRYVDLVAAHCIMSSHVIKEASAMQDHPNNNNGTDWRRQYTASQRRQAHMARFGKPVYLDWSYRVAEFYAQDVGKGKDGKVVSYLRSNRCGVSEVGIEVAWWVMVVKGIAWDMSTTGGSWRRDRIGDSYRWTADYVPSKFYGICTPVWIT